MKLITGEEKVEGHRRSIQMNISIFNVMSIELLFSFSAWTFDWNDSISNDFSISSVIGKKISCVGL